MLAFTYRLPVLGCTGNEAKSRCLSVIPLVI